MKIAGSIALVTGANRGLGRALAEALLAAGARKVYAAARDPSLVAIPGAQAVPLDITRADQVDAAARRCADATLIINNAGIAHRGSLLAPDAEASARASFETNVLGTLAVSRAFAPVLAANGGGALVNMLSVLSWISFPQIGAYCVSKAAAWSLTNSLRQELRAQGTLVLGVHAAYIDTDMAKGVAAPKTAPQVVARGILEAIESGREELLADELTRQTRLGLGGEPASYLQAA